MKDELDEKNWLQTPQGASRKKIKRLTKKVSNRIRRVNKTGNARTVGVIHKQFADLSVETDDFNSLVKRH